MNVLAITEKEFARLNLDQIYFNNILRLHKHYFEAGDKRARICIFMDNFVYLWPVFETQNSTDIAINME